jgi:hypothetical protein
MAAPPKNGTGEILIEIVVHGNVARVTAIEPSSGEEAVIVGPATAPKATLAEAARRKLEYQLKKLP